MKVFMPAGAMIATIATSMFFLFASAVCLLSCQNGSSETEVTDLRYEEVCGIGQSDFGYVNALALTGDKGFVLGSDKIVRRYDMDGAETGRFGDSGRAEGEYLMPMGVRVDGDKVYVWSAMSLTFLAYGEDGEFLYACPYDSAIKDFVPYGDRIFIYTAGMRESSLIDVYDITSKKVVESFGEPSQEHKCASMYSVCPMAVRDGFLYYMSRDRLEVFRYKLEGGSAPEKVLGFESNTFKVPEVTDAGALRSDRERVDAFFNEASFVVALMPLGGDRFKVVTSEGVYRRDNGKLVKDQRYYSVYEARGGKAGRVLSFHADVISDPAAVAVTDGNMYFIRKTMSDSGDDESYALCRTDFDSKR